MISILYNYIYLLQEREFIQKSEPVFKVGMTQQVNHERFKQYPKGSVLLFQMKCEDCRSSEKQILTAFKLQFNQRKDIGTEYFEGNENVMMDIIYQTIKTVNESIVVKQPKVFNCEVCDFSCSKQSNWEKHKLTQKHINHSLLTSNTDVQRLFFCTCGNQYKYRQGLSKHKALCTKKQRLNDVGISSELVIEIIKQYNEFKN